MAGETDLAASAGIQPGGRAPAPGRLALVQSFINSHYDLEREHGAELLASPAALRHWLVARGLLEARARVRHPDLARALELREALRSLAGGGLRPEPAERLNRLAVRAAVEVRFEPAGPVFVPGSGGGVPGALGVLLAICAQAVRDGSWERLRLCPGTDCGWVFFDHSRNGSGRWCSMSVCGGRAKSRAYYQRTRSSQGLR